MYFEGLPEDKVVSRDTKEKRRVQKVVCFLGQLSDIQKLEL